MSLSGISHFASQAVAHYPKISIGILTGIPIAIEIIFLIKRIWNDPGLSIRALKALKDKIIDCFSRREGESSSDFHYRLGINIGKIIFFISLMVGVGVLSFFIFPTSLTIPFTILAIFLVIKLIEYRKEIGEKIVGSVTWFKTAFILQLHESGSDAAKRIMKNVAIVLGIALVVTAIVLCCIYASYVAQFASSPFDFVDHLPGQTPLVVFLEYLAIGSLHLWRAIIAIKDQKRWTACFHTLSTLMAIVFPLYYFIATPYEMRLHHSFIGLALSIIPIRSLQFFGAAISFDSALYFFSSKRMGPDGAADLMNVILDHLYLIYVIYVLVIMFQYTINQWIKKFNNSLLN